MGGGRCRRGDRATLRQTASPAYSGNEKQAGISGTKRARLDGKREQERRGMWGSPRERKSASTVREERLSGGDQEE